MDPNAGKEVVAEQTPPAPKGGRLWAAGYTEDVFYRQRKLEDGTIAEVPHPQLTRKDRTRSMIHTKFDARVAELKEFFAKPEVADMAPRLVAKAMYTLFHQPGDILGDSRGNIYQVMNDGSFRKRHAVA